MGELVVRFVGGVHALFGAFLLATGAGLLADTTPDGAPGWVVVVTGFGLMAAMTLTGLRLGLGEPVPYFRAAVMIVVTLAGGLVGGTLVVLMLGR